MSTKSAWRLFAAGALVCLVLGGCASRTSTAPVDVALGGDVADASSGYRLREGDVVAVRFLTDRSLNYETPVTPRGTVTVPMGSEIRAAGRTVAELADSIAVALSEYLLDPTVSVVLRSVAEQPVFVIGEVGSPGRILWTTDLTVSMALAQAGGILKSGKPSSVMVVRTRGVEEPVAFKVDVTKVLSGRDLSQDVRLVANDVVYVPKSVIGQVDEFVDLFFGQIVPAQMFYLHGYDMLHLEEARWRW